MRKILAVAALLLAGAAPQRPRIPTLGETIEVSIVNVDVVVTDRDGRRAHGLTKDDFVILENGRRREISNFAEYSSAAGATSVEAPAPAEPPPAQKRNIAIFIESAKVLPHKAEELMASLRTAVEDIVREGDSVTLVVWSPQRQTRFDFSKDPKQIGPVLGTLQKDMGSTFDLTDQYRAQVEDARRFEMAILAITGKEPPHNGELLPAVDNAAMSESLIQLSMIRRKVQAINAVINGMAAAEGKKILLLVTHRLGDIAGREFFIQAGQPMPDQRLKNETRELVDSIGRNANAAAVTIYPVYSTGLPNRYNRSGSDYLVLMNEMLSLKRIAEETGGLEASGTTELAGVVRQLHDDVSDYYSLAYHIDSSRADQERKLEVKTKDPRYSVRARRNVVEKSDQTRMKDRLLMALFRSSTESMFPILAQLGESKTAKTPLRIRIPIRELTTVPEKDVQAGAFSVFVAAGDTGLRTSDVQQQTQRFEIPAKDLARARTSYFTYEMDVVLARKTDRVVVGVLDEVSKAYAVMNVSAAPPR